MQSSTVPVSPVKPAAGYIGGKRNLAGRICPIIDATLHDGYAEPFVGMGGIFLRRRARPTAEFINDVSGDVVNFFRVVREHHGFFMDTMRWMIASRGEFQRQLALPAEHLTDLQRAARFLYVQRLAFGGHVGKRNFGVSSTTGARFNVLRLERDLADLHDRLASVVIEQLDFGAFIARYDRPGMLFFMDPPYFGSEDDYGAGVFAPADFARLAVQLAAVIGKFILTINDRPETRAIFNEFHQLGVETTYTISSAGNGMKAGELLVSNFPIALT
jgi:DNA adenine methylase